MTTDTSEKGLETLIMRHMTGTDGLAAAPHSVAKPPTPYGATLLKCSEFGDAIIRHMG